MLASASPRGLQLDSFPPDRKFKKNTDTVDTITSNVLRDVPFSRYQLLQLADAKYIRISKNKTKKRDVSDKIEKTRKTLPCDLN